MNVVTEKNTEQSRSNEVRINHIVTKIVDHHPVAGCLDEVLTPQNYIWQMNICNHIWQMIIRN